MTHHDDHAAHLRVHDEMQRRYQPLRELQQRVHILDRHLRWTQAIALAGWVTALAMTALALRLLLGGQP